MKINNFSVSLSRRYSIQFFGPLFTFLFLILTGFTSLASAQVPITSHSQSGELNTIQNGDAWEALGSGLDAPANAMVTVGDFLYIAGGFENANGSPAIRFARFNHTDDSWEAINGPQDEVKAMVAHDGKIYIGGFFDNVDGEAYTHLAIYTIPTEIPGGWSAPTDLPDGAVLALAVHGEYLYVGGSFENVGALAVDGAARYHMTNDTWERIGGVDGDFFGGSFGAGSVSAITTDGTHVFFAGTFTVNLDGTDVPGVIQYTPEDDTWQALGQGIDESGTVNTLATYDGKLYAGSGDMSSGPLGEAGSIALSKIGVFNYNEVDRASEEWVSFGDVLDNSVYQLRVYNGKLFATGNFSSVDSEDEKGIAMYDFSTPGWTGFGGGLESFTFGAGESIGFAGGQLYASGGFDTAGGVSATRFARWSADFGTDESGGGGDGGGGDDPVIITLTAPSTGATGVSVEPLFTWNAPVGVTVDYYTLEIFDNAGLSDPAHFINFDEITTTSYQYGESLFDLPLLGNTTYYWQVTGYNSSDVIVAVTETAHSFTTVSLELATPTLVAPADDAEDVPLTPTFTWSKDASATGYLLEYSEGTTLSGTPNQVNLTIAQLTDSDQNYSYTLPKGSALTKGTEYTWQITVSGDAPLVPKTSSTSSFTTDDLLPGAFAWVAPVGVNSFTNNDLPLSLEWSSSEDATSYELSLKIGDQPITSPDSPITTTETSYELSSSLLVDGFTYTIEVNAVNEYGKKALVPLNLIYSPINPNAIGPISGESINATTEFIWSSTENFGLIPGTVMVQILYANDINADPASNVNEGVHFEFQGTTDIQEKKTLTELFATQNDRDISEVLSKTGQTIYWRLSNKSIRIAEDDPGSERQVVWSDLASFSIPVPAGITLIGPDVLTAGAPSDNFTLTVVDSEGNPSMVNQETTFSLTSSTSETGVFNPISPVTIASGQSSTTFTYSDTKIGEKTLTATWVSGDVNLDNSITVNKNTMVIAAEPALLTIYNPDEINNQSAVVGTAVAEPPSVIVTDLYENPVANSEILFTVTSGSGTINPVQTVETDVNGVATLTSWTLGPNLGENTVESVLQVDTDIRQTFTAHGLPKLVFISESHVVPIGETTDLITVEIQDANGNPVTRSEGTELKLSANPSEGVVFRNATDDADIIEVLIPANQSTVSFRVSSTISGTKSITATYLELSSASQNVLIHPFASGTGTQEDPYIITNVYMLQAMSGFTTSFFKLNNDIDASETEDWNNGAGFEPVPSVAGIDGDFNIIYDLYINRPNTDKVGLFKSGGQIKNIGLIDITIIGRDEVGGLVGYSGHSSNISKSFTKGSVEGRSEVGGLVGFGEYGRVDDSFSHSSVNRGGGLIGYIDRLDFKNTYSTGLVEGNGGGLVGGDRDGHGSGINSFWDVETSKKSTSEYASGRSTAQMKNQNTYSGWDFTNIWRIDTNLNDGYPALQNFPELAAPTLPEITLLTPGSSDEDVPEGVSLRPTFRWTALTGFKDVYYKLEVSTNQDFSTIFGSSPKSQGTEVKVDFTLDGPATYYWRIRATLGAESDEIVGESVTRSFKTNTNFEIVSPINEATDVGMDDKFEWYSNYPRYVLQVENVSAPSETFSLTIDQIDPSFTLSEFLSNPNLSTQGIGTFRPNKEYKWRVSYYEWIAFGGGTALSFVDITEFQTFTTGDLGIEPVTAFNLLTPVNLATNLTSTPTFTWEQSDNASFYILEISTTDDFTDPQFTSESIPRGDDDAEVSYTLADVDNVEYGMTYFWRVTALNSGFEITSISNSFSTPKETTILLSPEANKTFSTLDELEDEVFKWSYTSNSTYSASFLYMFDREVPEGANPAATANMVLNYQGADIENQTISANQLLVHGQTYYWNVDVRVEDDNTATYLKSEYSQFTIAPEKPVLKSPSENAAVVKNSPFQWKTEERFLTTSSNFSGKFLIQILFEDNPNADPLTQPEDGFHFVVNGTDALTETFTLEQLFDTQNDVSISELYSKFGKTLYWRVIINPTYDPIEGRVTPLDRETVWSNLRPFVSQVNAISKPILVSPNDNAHGVAISGRAFKWDPNSISDEVDEILLEVSTNQFFASDFTRSKKFAITSGLPTSITLDEDLEYLTKYYWRITASDSDINIHQTSEAFTFTTESSRPDLIKLISPSDSESSPISRTPTFTWKTDYKATRYELLLIESSSITTTINVTAESPQQDQLSYKLTVPSLKEDTEYGWKVIGYHNDVKGQEPSSGTMWMFMTDTNPVMFQQSMKLSILRTEEYSEDQLKLMAKAFCKVAPIEIESCNKVSIDITTSKTISDSHNSDIQETNDALIPVIWSPVVDETSVFPITGYAVEYREKGIDEWTTLEREEPADTIAIITGLKPETLYEIRLAAGNENGFGEFSDPGVVESIALQTVIDFIDEVAEIITTSIESTEMPLEFALYQNYPNPFNPATTIRFALPEASEVQLEVYSILGQRVAVLSEGLKPAGYHSFQIDASRWASGTYVYRLRAGNYVSTKKLLLIK